MEVKTHDMKVEYVDHMGDDLMVVNAAKVSFDKHAPCLDERGEKLIDYLSSHKHWTPFGHPHVCMRMTTPIFVAAQLKRHVVGATEGGADIAVINEVSRRYDKQEPTFFVPNGWRGAPTGGAKQGSSGYLDSGDQWSMDSVLKHCHEVSIQSYETMLNAGVAPEQARMVLPQTMYTSWYWTGSLAFWARLCVLRLDPHAQYETRQVAVMVQDVIVGLFPKSWESLMKNWKQEHAPAKG